MAAKKKAKKTVRKAAKKPAKKAVKKTTKKSAKKSAKKPAKKSSRKSAKKAVKKTSKKAIKKPAKKTAKKSVKKTVKKTAGKKKTSAKSKKTNYVEICSACHSPDLRADLINDQLIYTCQRCGYRSPDAMKVTKKEALVILKNRREQLRSFHLSTRAKHKKMFYHHLDTYKLRSWFRFFSLLAVILGVILLTSSNESTTGALFTIIGAVGLYTSIKI